jgi:hypothetical protein
VCKKVLFWKSHGKGRNIMLRVLINIFYVF